MDDLSASVRTQPPHLARPHAAPNAKSLRLRRTPSPTTAAPHRPLSTPSRSPSPQDGGLPRAGEGSAVPIDGEVSASGRWLTTPPPSAPPPPPLEPCNQSSSIRGSPGPRALPLGIHSEVSLLTPSPGYRWYQPPPATQALPLASVPSPRNGGGAAALFDTASEAVSTLEQQYRATLKQLDIVQGMYTRLSEHNSELASEFNALRGQLEAFKEAVSFGLYNEIRRVKMEAKSTKQYVDLVLRDFGQYLAVMGREVRQGVLDVVADATGESALLPYYQPDSTRAQATAASVAAGAGMRSRNVYGPDGWFGAISPRGSSGTVAGNYLEQRPQDGAEAASCAFSADQTAADEMKLLLAPPPPSSSSNRSGGGGHQGVAKFRQPTSSSGSLQFWSSGDSAAQGALQSLPTFTASEQSSHAQSINGDGKQCGGGGGNALGRFAQNVVVTQGPDGRTPAEQLAELKRQLVLAEGKRRVVEQDCERRVQRVKEAYREREATLTTELLLLRRALGMPTDDLSRSAANPDADGVNGALQPTPVSLPSSLLHGLNRHRNELDGEGKRIQQSQTLPYEEDICSNRTSSAREDEDEAWRRGMKRGPRQPHGSLIPVDGDGHSETFRRLQLLRQQQPPAPSVDERNDRPPPHNCGSDSGGSRDDSMSVTGSQDEEEEKSWYDPEYGEDGASHLPMRKRYAPLLFDSADGRAVEKKVRSMVAQSRRRQQRHYRSDEVDLQRPQGGPHDDLASEQDTCDDVRSDGDSASRPQQQRAGSSRHLLRSSPQAAPAARLKGGVSAVHRRDRFSPLQEQRLQEAAQKLLGLVKKEKKEVAAAGKRQTLLGASVTTFASPRRDVACVTRAKRGGGTTAVSTVVLGPGARQLPDQEAMDICKQAEGRLVPSGQLIRPATPSDVSKVAHGLWAEQLLAQRGL